jgi:1-deoxy-D-xylulose-5-phosphate reductoisomerase
VAIEKFLRGEIGFLDISKVNLRAFREFEDFKPTSIEDIFEIDEIVRNFFK